MSPLVGLCNFVREFSKDLFENDSNRYCRQIICCYLHLLIGKSVIVYANIACVAGRIISRHAGLEIILIALICDIMLLSIIIVHSTGRTSMKFHSNLEVLLRD